MPVPLKYMGVGFERGANRPDCRVDGKVYSCHLILGWERGHPGRVAGGTLALPGDGQDTRTPYFPFPVNILLPDENDHGQPENALA
jgi:hypothetical protein